MVLKPNPYPNLPRHPSSLSVAPLIPPMRWVRRFVGIYSFRNNNGPVIRQTMKLRQ
jgi:hypothetical protein